MVAKSIYEKPSGEVYTSKSAMVKHESSESPKMEKKEDKLKFGIKPKNLKSKRVKK